MIHDLSMQVHVIGLGVTNRADLSTSASLALKNAQVVLGSKRQLRVVEQQISDSQQCRPLPALAQLQSQLQQLQTEGTQSLAVLASGDPLYYGIGRWLGQVLSPSQLHFYPAVSSIQAVCHRLHLSLQEVEVVSLHGRPVATLNRHLRRNKTFIVLTDKDSQPKKLAQICESVGLQESRFWVCERMGYPDEQIRQFGIEQLIEQDLDFDPLHVVVIQARGGQSVLPEFPGIPDKQFKTEAASGGGMITKREVRLAILSLMQVAADDTVWDIGAGCGSVAIELARWQAQARVYAIEQNRSRLECLAVNQNTFGVVNNLHIIEGRAPAVLKDLPSPDKVFIGGSDGELETLLPYLWDLLPVGGKIVASAVTEPSRLRLLEFYQQRQEAGDAQTETMQVAINRGVLLAEQLVYRPNLPVSLFAMTRRGDQ